MFFSNQLVKVTALEPARQLYMEAVRYYSKAGKLPLKYFYLQCLEADGVVTGQVDLITDFLETFDDLYKLNSSVPDILKAYVSSAL